MDNEIKSCRLCKESNLVDVIDLGEQIITSRWPTYGDTSTPSTKIVLTQCQGCGLVQLKHTVISSELYEYEYGYRSGISNTMRAHLKAYNEQVSAFSNVKEGDSVLDIGSNDSTFLRNYPDTIERVGCDPTGTQFKEYYGTDVQLIPTYFTKGAIEERFGPDKKFKVVTSISMFYDLPDPVQFANDISAVLEEDGIWSLEQSYIKMMLERNSIDTICHEHLEYYGVKQIKDIMNRAGLKILHIEFNDCNGGSMRVFVGKQSNPREEFSVASIVKEEERMGIHSPPFYTEFMNRCKREVDRLLSLLKTIKASGQETWIYGASTKGNCLLQFAGIGQNLCRYAVERNLSKVGKMTSTGIEIISEETMRKSPPAFLLVLPWHFRDEILVREEEFLKGGGQFIFPLPHMEIVSRLPRALVTGWNGQIARYVKEELKSSYCLYGVGTQGKTPGIVFSRESLVAALNCIQPDVVVHLAGVSNTEKANESIIETIDINGSMCAKICEYIHTHGMKTKVFNASSSELYKGHGVYTVEEDDTHYKPATLYAIGKLTSHLVIEWYRKTYNLPFSNGILFMTESAYRGKDFLIPKCKNHASVWKNTRTPLTLGSLESMRNITHAADVASAIRIILEQDKGDTYNICNPTTFVKVETIVKKIYESEGIFLKRENNSYTDTNSGELVLHINTNFRDRPTEINGYCQKLRNLEWTPVYSTIDMILSGLKQ
jgi:NDP-4-keto-2,6-dideoxyhexose 3-C-methyltransferase